jgi:ribosomal protein S18 acetylase RimI-like enzyme
MRFQDWREVSPDVLRPLYDAERARWLETLHWDAAPTLEIVETARVRGELPGVLAWESGRVAGWSFYVPAGGTLQIGSLVAKKAATVRALFNAICDSPEAVGTAGLSCFVLPTSGALVTALTRQRFDVRPQSYLVRELGDAAGPGNGGPPLVSALTVEPWTTIDAEIVRLLARAYAGSEAGKCFAPGGRFEEWVHYVQQLLCTPVCGVFQPAASFVVRTAGSARPVAAVLTTAIGAGSAHIAQVVVDPGFRRTGIGELLVGRACAAAAETGYRRMTLIVGRDNTPARSLYQRLGFTHRAEFVFAARSRPLRRVALPPLRSVA